MIKSFFKKAASFITISLFLSLALVNAETGKIKKPCILETSLWMLMNLTSDSPDFYQLSLGYQLDERNTVFINGITWKYNAPLGIPMYNNKFNSPDENFPGYIRSFGIGFGYQRFVWRNLYASLYAIPFLQNFYDSEREYIQSGFQLYLQIQLGYQINFFKGRLFLKPAIYANYWPVNTNFPDEFQDKEKNWPNFQPFEPHLNIGFRF